MPRATRTSAPSTRPAPVPGRRKADVVADDLLSRIVSGKDVVGELLPKEEELATHYGVNRGVVREAIKLLEVHRLVRPIRRRGTEILDPMASLTPQVVEAMLFPKPGTIDRKMLADLLEIRATLDEQMTRLAAQRRTKEDLARMERCLGMLEAALGNPQAYFVAVGEMAAALAHATHNQVYVMLQAWHEQVTSRLAGIFAVARPAVAVHLEGTRALVGLVRARDEESACALVRRFHELSGPRLMAAAALASGEPLAKALKEVS